MGQFYGSDHVTSDIKEIYDRLLGIWAADTCAPRMRDEWTPENPTRGQCSVTAFLVQDLLGGKVYGIRLPDGNYHCYNDVDGMVFDLTSGQFPDIELDYRNNPEQFREDHFSKLEKRQRYQLLKQRYEQAVEEAEKEKIQVADGKKKIAVFCIPAHGHTNPMLPVVTELVRRGNLVRFYSFSEFEEKIRATGAEFWCCDTLLPDLTKEEESGLKRVSTTEMTIQDLRITRSMDGYLRRQFTRFEPDVVFTDSVCFWGKLNADKFKVPMVVSTSTFAFNQMSSEYMKNSPREIADLMLGLPRIAKELKTLEQYGYYIKGPLALVQNDNKTDTIVYTSEKFQPYAESFSDHYLFAGPSVYSKAAPNKQKSRPLVYISMGTVINDRPMFYRRCIEAMQDLNLDVLISCGNAIDIEKLGELPDNVRVEPYVDQLDILSRADVFITHCGMNSVTESLYMATPMVLYPQTGEQKAVARRVTEINAGLMLKDDSAEGIRFTVQEVLGHGTYSKAAEEYCENFRSCPGAEGAAGFIESAPHQSEREDILSLLNMVNGIFGLAYWVLVISAILLTGFLATWKYVWIIGIAGGILYPIVSKPFQKAAYRKLMRMNQKKNREKETNE